MLPITLEEVEERTVKWRVRKGTRLVCDVWNMDVAPSPASRARAPYYLDHTLEPSQC